MDNKFNFDQHVSIKLHAFAQTDIKSFYYSPLIWMFDRSLNNHINKLHERAIRLTCKDHLLTFEELLKVSNTYIQLNPLSFI